MAFMLQEGHKSGRSDNPDAVLVVVMKNFKGLHCRFPKFETELMFALCARLSSYCHKKHKCTGPTVDNAT